MLSALNLKEITSAFVVLFAIIDITGASPILLDYEARGHKIKPLTAAVASFVLMITFLFLGEALLSLFGVDISSFAVAGSVVLLVMSLEMTFGVQIFKEDSTAPEGATTLVPVVFPLIAGAGALTTIIALRAEYHAINIILAITLNMILVYIVIRYVHLVKRLLGEAGVYILRKFFGIILMAIAVKLFVSNVTHLF